MSQNDLEQKLRELKLDNAKLKESITDLMVQLKSQSQLCNKRVNDSEAFETEFEVKVAELISEKPHPRKFKTIGDLESIQNETFTQSRISALESSLAAWSAHLQQLDREVFDEYELYQSIE